MCDYILNFYLYSFFVIKLNYLCDNYNGLVSLLINIESHPMFIAINAPVNRQKHPPPLSPALDPEVPLGWILPVKNRNI